MTNFCFFFWPCLALYWPYSGHGRPYMAMGGHIWPWEALFFSSMRATGRGAGGSAAGCRAHRWKKQKWASGLEEDGSVWPFWSKKAIFGKCSDWLETPLKRCASTRAFEWCNRRVIWWPTSKVMAKKLKSSRVAKLHIFGIATDGSVTHRVAIISLAIN